MTGQSRPLRVGIIGANWGVVGHLPAWRNLDGVEVTSICTSREETACAASQAHGIPNAFSDFRRMIDEGPVDIIDVGTRPRLRYDMVMHALRAGKHVINANPFAVDINKAKDILTAQRDAGVVGMVEAQFQWLPQFRQMKAMIDDGALGNLIAVELKCHFPLIRDAEAIFPFVTRPGYSSDYNWLGMPGEGASALRNLGGHCLHSLIYLFGGIESVSATLQRSLDEWRFDDSTAFEPQTIDTAFANLHFCGGGVGQLNICWSVAGARGFELEAYGANGRLRIEAPTGFPGAENSRLYYAPAASREGLTTPEQLIALPEALTHLRGRPIPVPVTAPVVVPMTLMLNEMISAIREGRSCDPSFAQALRVQAICEAAEESDRKQGERVVIPA